MTEENNNTGMDQNEFMKRMKAIATDLWGGIAPAEEAAPEPAVLKEAARQETYRTKDDIQSIWKTADETIDWTDALAHSTPTDGLTGSRMWAFYHKYAEKVLSGDLDAYTEILQKANPLGELTDYAENISIRAVTEDRLESCFICKEELMKKNRKLYLSAVGLRIARDLLACLPVGEVGVTAEADGKTVLTVTYRRDQLMHINFSFLDPVRLTEDCGGRFGD